MKTISILIFSLLVFTSCSNYIDSSLVNKTKDISDKAWSPAICYAITLGYKYKIENGVNGSSHAIITLPNNEKVPDFPFLRGLVGQEYSYCARKGYKTISDTTLSINGYHTICTACIKLDSLNRIIEKLTLDSLMKRYGDELCKPMNGNK